MNSSAQTPRQESSIARAKLLQHKVIVLIGTLSYLDKENLRQHVIRGNWKYEDQSLDMAEATAQRFKLIRNIPSDEDVTQLPKDGVFHGSFSMQIKLRNHTAAESGVKLTFKEDKENEGEFAVNGSGLNGYGAFKLFGTATKSPTPPGEVVLRIRKEYISLVPALWGKSVRNTSTDQQSMNVAGGQKSSKPLRAPLPASGQSLPSKEEKERFFMFTRVLMK